MDAMEFVSNYEKFLDEIGQVCKTEFQPVLDELKQEDPHDLVRPDTYFHSTVHARGVVWSTFLKKVRKNQK